MKNFHQVFSSLLQTKLSLYEKESLDKTTCIKIYSTIFETVTEIFQKSNITLELSNETINYIAQQYYDGILINGNQELDPNVFTQRAKLENIATNELAFLTVMFGDTDFRHPIVAEIKRRS